MGIKRVFAVYTTIFRLKQACKFHNTHVNIAVDLKIKKHDNFSSDIFIFTDIEIKWTMNSQLISKFSSKTHQWLI